MQTMTQKKILTQSNLKNTKHFIYKNNVKIMLKFNYKLMVKYLKKERKPDNLTQNPSIMFDTGLLFRMIKKPTKRTEHSQYIETLREEVLEDLHDNNVGGH